VYAYINGALTIAADLLGRSLRDAMSSTSDDTIEKFTASFKELRDHFCSKTALTTSRIVHTMHRDVLQLGSAIEGLGKACHLFTINFNTTDVL